MAGYLIMDVEVIDEELQAEYRRRAVEAAEQHGGRFLLRGDVVQAADSDQTPHRRMVVLEFETLEQAKAWPTRPEYQALQELRERSSNITITVVEGD